MNVEYAKELALPAKMPEINPLMPAMRGMLRMIVRMKQKETESFEAPPGVSCQKIMVKDAGERELPVIIVQPEESKPRPGIMMLHGGGFYLPIQTITLKLACAYAQGTGASVWVPDYRLIPADPAPAALEDAALCWNVMVTQGEQYGLLTDRLMVCGDSAGGALAAGLCRRLHELGGVMPRGQMLIYPALDDRGEPYPSRSMEIDAIWLERANAWMWEAYLQQKEEVPVSWLVPLRADSYEGLPPAYLEVQEYDILRDEGRAYAEHLKKAGIAVRKEWVQGSYHGFDQDLSSPLVQRMIRRRMEFCSSILL